MDIQRLVDAYIVGLNDGADNTEIRQKLVTDISVGDASLLELVQALGSYLASDEASRRSNGIQALSDLLNDLPKDAIPQQAIVKLISFFSSRLSDATCVPHILTALIALLRLPTFQDQYSVEVLRSLFQEVHVQSFQYSTRSIAYQLIELVIGQHSGAVKQMGNDFVLGFAQMLDGEKDPRSLSVAFKIIPQVAQLVDIKSSVEDLFDVLFCYFPITFKHREGDPSAISPASLKTALREALTCSPDFGDYLVKPLVEKTSATASSVKIDAYDTLTAGAKVYRSSAFEPAMEALVDQIREDTVMAADEAVVSAALDTLEEIYGLVSPCAPSLPSTNDDDEGTTPLDYVLKDAVLQLTADEIKNSDQIGKLLSAVARSSAYNCSVVSDAVLPIIIERLNNTEVLTMRRELIDVLNYVLSASCDTKRKAECLDADKVNLLNIYRVESSVPLDKEYSFLHMTRLKGITLLVLLPKFLDSNETEIALLTIARAAIERNEDENVNDEATHLLIQLSQSNSEQIASVVLPMYFDSLCEDIVSVAKVSRLLDSLGAIGVASRQMLVPVVQGLTSLVAISSHYATVAGTIRRIVETAAKANNSQDICSKLLTTAVTPLSDWCFERADKDGMGRVVGEVAKTLVAVFSQLPEETQTACLKPLFDRYQSTLLGSQDYQQLLPLFSAAICSCRPETQLPVDDVERWVGQVAVASQATEDVDHQTACLEIIASVLNKTKDVQQRHRITDTVVKTANGKSGIRLRQWIGRALVACNDKEGYTSVDWLLSLIKKGDSGGLMAADGFGIILGEHSWSVTKETHGVIRRLSKQRFYSTIVPELSSSFDESRDDQIRTQLLVVLTTTVRYMPKSVLMNDIQKVVPMLMAAVRLTGGDLKAASLRTITMCVMEAPELLKDEITVTIVPLLLGSIQGDGNSVGVRRAALDILSLLPEKYSAGSLSTARRDILRGLVMARDDRKRLVRQDAVRAYNKWLDFI